MNDIETQFDFDVVCPDRKIISDKAWQVVVPGDEGDFGVLANHSAVVASLRAGVVTVYQEISTEKPQRIFVSGGFVDITATNCTILADDAINVDELDQDEIEKQIENLTEDLGMAEGDFDVAKVEGKLVLAKAKLSAVSGELTV